MEPKLRALGATRIRELRPNEAENYGMAAIAEASPRIGPP